MGAGVPVNDGEIILAAKMNLKLETVDTGDITNAAVTDLKIADNAVTTDKIAGLNVTENKMAIPSIVPRLLDSVDFMEDGEVPSYDGVTGKFEWIAAAGLRSATRIVAAYNSKDTVNADYVCDGTNDDVEINAAIDSLPATGGMILLMDGTFTIGATLTIDVDNTTIKGMGSSTIIKLGANVSAITASSRANILISDLQLDGVKATYDTTTNDGIAFSSVTDSKITNCYVHDFKGVGIEFNGCSRCKITNNTLKNCDSGGPVWLTNGGSNNIISNNYVENATGGSRNCIGLTGATPCNENIISNNVIIGGTGGIHLSYPDRNIITGNFCADGAGNGTWGGIMISDDADNNIVTGNYCEGNQGYGITVMNANCDKNLIHGNICLGNTTGQINDSGTGTILADNIEA